MGCVAVYLHIPPWRQTDVGGSGPNHRQILEIWLQKPGGLWPSSARLLFLPNKRIRGINAHKYL